MRQTSTRLAELSESGLRISNPAKIVLADINKLEAQNDRIVITGRGLVEGRSHSNACLTGWIKVYCRQTYPALSVILFRQGKKLHRWCPTPAPTSFGD
jgi:hypothetical protein